jgi:hypothetical protein
MAANPNPPVDLDCGLALGAGHVAHCLGIRV